MLRRNFLKASGAAALAAAGAGTWYAWDQGVLSVATGTEYAPWHEWNEPAASGPLQLLRAAILAASPHNTQPWRFRVTASSIELYVEASRSVAGLDPYLREAYLGLGCALENLSLSAEAHGYKPAITINPGKLNDPATSAPLQMVARMDLSPSPPVTDELYTAIPNRHTNRSVYDPERELPWSFVAELSRLTSASPFEPESPVRLTVFLSQPDRDRIARISSAANFELYSDPAVEAGSEQWIRWNHADAAAGRDGLTIDTFGLSPMAATFAKLAPASLLRYASSPSQRGSLYASQFRSARLVGMLSVRDRFDIPQTIQAGRLWQRINLLATARGIAARPCNEAIEMIDHEHAQNQPARRLAELTEVLRDPAAQPTFLFLMGYATLTANPSPRRPIEAVVLS
jgi:hypothetical protein